MDAVFGYDFFISYSWIDGGVYAAALARRLQQRGFQVFLDREDYASGDDWKEVGAWTLRRTGQLILVGSAGALTSAPVEREVEIFRGTGRRIIPIDFGGSLSRLAPDTPLGRHLQDAILRVSESKTALDAGPSDEVVATIRRTFTLVRQDQKRLRALAAVACVLALAAVVSSFLAVFAFHQKTVADENARQTFLRQADLSASIAFRLFGEGRPLLGLKVASTGAPTVIEHATPLTTRLALALSRGWSQIQEEAEFRHTDGDITNAIWSPDGSRVATSTLTDGPRVWNAANGENQAMLANGRRDYVLIRDPSDLSFSADGRRLAAQFGDAASVWETGGWTEILNVRCGAVEARHLRLSPDGKSFAAHCKDGVHVWDVATKRELHHRRVAVKDGSMESLASFEFADSGDTLAIVDDTKATVGVLRHIASGTPEWSVLQGVTADIDRGKSGKGFVSLHPTRVPTEIVLRGHDTVFRVDLARDKVIWRMPFASDGKQWFQVLRSVDAIATATLVQDGDVEYRIAQAPNGPELRAGRLHFTGQHADAFVKAVSFQDDGKGIGVALNVGAQVVALGEKDQEEIVFSGPCSGTAADARAVTLLADGSRMIATCADGGARMVRLRQLPALRLPGQHPVARFGGALVRVGGTGAASRFETLDADGKVTGQSDALGEEVAYWLAHDTGSAVLFQGASGRVRSWRPGERGVATYAAQLGPIRAARFAPDGSQAALLDGYGTFVRLRLGQDKVDFQGRVGGPLLPAIDYAIDPSLSVVAFTTANLLQESKSKPSALKDASAFAVVATPGTPAAQLRCRSSPGADYARVLFKEGASQPTLYLLQSDRTLERLVLKADAAGFGPCPAALSDAFRPEFKWQLNPFPHKSLLIVEPDGADRPGRLIFGGAQGNPLELVDLESQRSITDLNPVSGGYYPLALSADRRYLAARGDTARTIDIFDVTTGSLLRRIRGEQDIAQERGALVFAPGNQVLLVRLASGTTVTYAIVLRDGMELLDQVGKARLGPLTDDEKREIYDIRLRLSRPPSYG